MKCLSDKLFDTENEECNRSGLVPIGVKMKVEKHLFKSVHAA